MTNSNEPKMDEANEPLTNDLRKTAGSAETIEWLRSLMAPLRPPKASLVASLMQFVNPDRWEYRLICYAGFYDDIDTAGDGYAIIVDDPGNIIERRDTAAVTEAIRAAIAMAEASRKRRCDPIAIRARERVLTEPDVEVRFWLLERINEYECGK